MYKLLILVFLTLPIWLQAQTSSERQQADSLTLQYYLNGQWDDLLLTAQKAIAQNIDFKFLRQRMGYAYFMKGNYFASQKQYEKALVFDPLDSGTIEYLYYCGLNTGNMINSRFRAAALPDELKEKYKIKAFLPVSEFDLEYNYKSNNYEKRSDPTYFRAGITTNLGYRLSIYQSASNYKQYIDTFLVKQPDYFVLGNLALSPHTSFIAAYHYLNTSFGGYKYPGNLYYGLLSTNINRFYVGINASYFKYDLGEFTQAGIQAGATLPGKHNIYLTTYLNQLTEYNKKRLIFSQTAGVMLVKSLWAEASITLGNMQNYNDHNALYLYNSIDPTLFRGGITLYWHFAKHFTLYGNYIYDTKQIEQTDNQYTQQSFLGGIVWKR